jgi:hypothetical protein
MEPEKGKTHVRGLRFSQELLEQVEAVAHDEKRSFANAALWLIERGLRLYWIERDDRDERERESWQ